MLIASLAAFAADPDPATLFREGHYKQARAVLEAKLKQNPKDANALQQMAAIRLEYNDYDGALSLAEQSIAIDPKNAQAHCELAESLGNKIESAGIFSKMGMAKRIKSEAETCLALDPRNTDAMDTLIEFHAGAPGIMGGDKKKLAEFVQQMIATDPMVGNLKVAEMAAKEKNWAKVEAAYKAALAADPKSIRTMARLGGFYASEAGGKKYELAEKLARDAIKLAPLRSTGYALLVQMLVVENREAEVEAVVAVAEKNVPDDLNTTFQAGRILLLQNKNFPQAEKYFRRYLTQEPEGGAPPLAAAHWRLGLVLEKEGKKAEALTEVQMALRLKPDFKQAEPDLKRLKG